MLRNMRIAHKTAVIATILVIGFLVTGLSAHYVIEKIKVNGPMYQEIVQTKDLIADILPPPKYIIESYLTLFELADEENPGRRRELAVHAARLRDLYGERQKFWEVDLADTSMRGLLLADSHRPAMEFFRIQDQEFLPAIEAGDQKQADSLLTGPLKKAYQEHLAAIRTLVSKAEKKIARIESEAAESLFWETLSLYAVSFFIMCLAVVLTLIVLNAIARGIHKNLNFAKCVASGDLDCELAVTRTDELGLLAQALRGMVAKLREKIEESQKSSREARQEAEKARKSEQEAEDACRLAEEGGQSLRRASKHLEEVAASLSDSALELSGVIEQSSQGARIQASRLGETAAAMEQMNATVLEVARSASSAAKSSSQAHDRACEGAATVDSLAGVIGHVRGQALSLKENMSRLGVRTESIGQILNVISDIADQTNLLALNAAIEAARAGDAGRGFAVVADEVRKLAEKTMAATREVGEAITGVQLETRNNIAGVDRTVGAIQEVADLAGKSGAMLKEIVAFVDGAANQVQSIAIASEEQSAASDEINRAIEEINRISSETSTAMERSAQVVSGVAGQAGSLKSLIHELADEGLPQGR